MLYYKYKDGSGYAACMTEPKNTSPLIEISEQEYNEYILSIAEGDKDIKED